MEHSKQHIAIRGRTSPLIATDTPERSLSYSEVVAGDLGVQAESGHLLEYWHMLRRHGATIMTFILLGLLIAVGLTVSQGSVYRAHTALEIQNINSDFLNVKQVNPVSEDSAVNVLTDVQTQIKIIESDSLVNRVINLLKPTGELQRLYGNARRPSTLQNFLKLPLPSVGEVNYTVRTNLQKAMDVHQVGETRVIELSFKSADAAFAAQFVNALASEYIQSNVEARWQMSERTGRWLSSQLGDIRARLQQSESTLQTYAMKSGLLFVASPFGNSDERDMSEQTLRQIQQAVSSAQAERAATQSRYEISLAAEPDSLGEVVNDKPLRDLQAKLMDLRRQEAELVVTYTPNHEKVRRVETQIAPLQAEFDRERAAIKEHIRTDYDGARRHEKLLRDDFTAQSKVVADQAEKSIQYNILRRDVDSNRQLYDSTLQQVKEATVSAAIRASNIRVIDPAEAPERPESAKGGNCLAGLVGGLLLGLAFVVGVERADHTLQAPGDAKACTNLPELGIIPTANLDRSRRVRGRDRSSTTLGRLTNNEHNPFARVSKDTNRDSVVSWQGSYLIADAFQSLLTSLMFTGEHGRRRPKVLVLTSASRTDGKTSITTNLGLAVAQINRTVLIIDGDLRRPRLHKIFDLQNKSGLSTLLTSDEVDLDTAIEFVEQTSTPRLHVLTSGPLTPLATPNLLHSPRLGQLLAKVKRKYDLVLIDTPPMLHMTDARILGKLADGVIVVVRSRKTTREAARSVTELFADDGTPVIGTILNAWDPRKSQRSYYNAYNDAHYTNWRDTVRRTCFIDADAES